MKYFIFSCFNCFQK